MNLKDFIEEESIKIIVEGNLKSDEFITRYDKGLDDDKGLYRSLIKACSPTSLYKSVPNEVFPKLWKQGNDSALICKVDDDIIIVIFYSTDLDIIHEYTYIHELGSKINQLYSEGIIK